MIKDGKFNQFKKEMKSPKTRLVVILTGGVLLVFTIGGAFYYSQISKNNLPPQSSISNTTPGYGEGNEIAVTEQYANIIAEDNRIKAEFARNSGTSSLPKVLPEVDKREFAFNALSPEKPTIDDELDVSSLNTNYTAAQPANQDYQAQSTDQEEIKLLKERMKGSLVQLVGNEWSGYGFKTNVVSDKEQIKAAHEERLALQVANVTQQTTSNTPKTILKAGTTCYAALTTGLNTDDSMWASAQLLSCKGENGQDFSGSVLSGLAVLGSEWASGVQFTFSQMSSKQYPQSFSISAISLDEDTNRPAVRSDKDRHMISKIVTATILGVAEGVGEGLKQGGRNENLVSDDGSQVVQTDKYSNEQLAILGATNAIHVASEPLKSVITRPTTHTIENNKTIGIYFMSDVSFN